MSGEQRFRANPVVVLREESDDWAILFNPDTGEALGINPVGVTVWRLLDEARRVNDIVAAVVAEFDGIPDTAFADVEGFLADLRTCGFVATEAEEGAG